VVLDQLGRDPIRQISLAMTSPPGDRTDIETNREDASPPIRDSVNAFVAIVVTACGWVCHAIASAFRGRNIGVRRGRDDKLTGAAREVTIMRMRSIAPIAVCGLLVGTGIAGCGPTKRPDGNVGLLAVGSPAPDVVGEDAAGRMVKLSDQKGKLAVVYFYPKDGTPGCTTQACAFRDAFDRLSNAGVVVFGVSRDSAESHRKFRKEHNLPFLMVSDESGDVARAYGVPSKLVVMSARVTFLIDADGKVARVWPDVDPALDAQRVLEAAGELRAGRGPS
jgi:peroxiredoxin Q/BCP